MIECDKFHETKRERKYYEDKKQKALRYIDHTLDDWYNVFGLGIYEGEFKQFTHKLNVIRKMVNKI